jgi:hypothetical protein
MSKNTFRLSDVKSSRYAPAGCEGKIKSVLQVDAGAAERFGAGTALIGGPLGAAPVGGPDDDPASWTYQSAALLRRVTPALAQQLAGAAAAPFILVRGLPADEPAPVTAYNGVVDCQTTKQAIVNALAVVGTLGLQPMCYADENLSILHAVVPDPKATETRSSRGSRIRLPWHKDYVNRPIHGFEPVEDLSPAAERLIFSVVRTDPTAPMEYLPMEAVIARLSPKDIVVAMSRAFNARTPQLFKTPVPPRQCCILHPDGGGGYVSRLNLGEMSGRTSRAAALLAKIGDIVEDEGLSTRVAIERGDVVVFNNVRLLHRRSGFEPRFDGTDRYLIRVGTTSTLAGGIPADPTKPWMWR